MINDQFTNAMAMFDKSDLQGCGKALKVGILNLTDADRAAMAELDHDELCDLWVACDMANLTDVKEGPIKDFCDKVDALGN
ncbi:MAG: hypothetical protein HQK58_00440 [Deltaproteobacteria bacterium]|nr:hypothetical protein [Deltaproteobacteria bacterium]